MKTLFLTSSLFLLLVGLSPAQQNQVDSMNWPQWRGPNRDGFLPKDAPWPAKISEGNLTQSWRVELGKGFTYITRTLKKHT